MASAVMTSGTSSAGAFPIAPSSGPTWTGVSEAVRLEALTQDLLAFGNDAQEWRRQNVEDVLDAEHFPARGARGARERAER